MKLLSRSPRTIVALLFVGVILAVASASSEQAPAQSAEDAARFTGPTSVLDTTNVRATRRRFEAGSRSAWHSHDGGQLLFVEEGRGRVQERGKAMKEMGPGESHHSGPNVVHWHGAVPSQALIQASLAYGDTKWLEKVTDAEYAGRR